MLASMKRKTAKPLLACHGLASCQRPARAIADVMEPSETSFLFLNVVWLLRLVPIELGFHIVEAFCSLLRSTKCAKRINNAHLHSK